MMGYVKSGFLKSFGTNGSTASLQLLRACGIACTDAETSITHFPVLAHVAVPRAPCQKLPQKT